MAETEHFLADVHPRKPDWNFNVYIIRLWEVPSKYNPNEVLYLEMILQDCKGERLHAVVPDWLINRWKNVLKEFTMFNMKWFLVAEDKLKSRTTETDMFLSFFNRTEVTTVVNPPFPLEALRLKPINEILQAQQIDSAELFDVVALVVGKEDPREMLSSKTGKKLKRLVLVIEDTEKNRINCTLFNKDADAILPYLGKTREEPLIVVLHYFKATRWNGKTSIHSNFDLSKVHINPDLAEVVAFKERLMNGGTGTSSRISHVSSQSAVSAVEELTQPNAAVMKIEDVVKLGEAVGEDSVSTKTPGKRPLKDDKSGSSGKKGKVNDNDQKRLEEFAYWVLCIGDGKCGNDQGGVDRNIIPDEFLIKDYDNPVEAICKEIFPEMFEGYTSDINVQERAILAPTPNIVDEINQFMMSLNKEESKTYYSADEASPSELHDATCVSMIPPEFLNSIKCSDIPNFELTLKVGTPVMLLLDIDPAAGLCKGTRLVITKLGKFVIEAKSMSGRNNSEKVFIPRMDLTPSDQSMPFKLQRRQFPIMVSYAMTINKSQGQSLSRVGLFLKKPFFTHGRLYDAISRVTIRDGLKILL